VRRQLPNDNCSHRLGWVRRQDGLRLQREGLQASLQSAAPPHQKHAKRVNGASLQAGICRGCVIDRNARPKRERKLEFRPQTSVDHTQERIEQKMLESDEVAIVGRGDVIIDVARIRVVGDVVDREFTRLAMWSSAFSRRSSSTLFVCKMAL